MTKVGQRVSVIGLVVCSAMLFGSTVAAQPGGGFGRGGGPPFGGGGGFLELLRNEDVRERLGIVDDQLDEIRKLAEGMRGPHARIVQRHARSFRRRTPGKVGRDTGKDGGDTKRTRSIG